MKILVLCMAVFSLSQGFPRPSSNNDNIGDRRQGVHYGYPENPSEPYTSNQATAYSSDPADTNLDTTNPSWSEPVQSTTADQQSTAYNQNTVADQSSAQETTTPSSNAGSQSQNTERQTETSQAQATQTESQASDTSTSTQTQTQASTSQTKDSASTGTQTVAPQTATQSPSYQDSNSASSQVSTPASTAQTTTQTQTPQTQDATAANQPQTSTYDSQSSTQSPSQTAQDSTSMSSQSQTYNQNKASNDYVNPPQTYNAGENDQNNPQSDTPSQTASQTPKTSYNPQGNDVPDNTQYQVENVTSKTVPDSDQAKPSSPVYLSSTATANVADSSNPDDKKKSPTFNKETVVHGNHAVTYLELPKHLHKPAIVKYQVQISPKVKGVPIEQEIAIMPPEGAGGERKPLVLLKQVVAKPTDERIQVIVPKTESSSVNTPKVEVKGGHVDQEALNSHGQYQDQSQSQGQFQDQPQGQDQYQGQGQPQGQGQYQSQDQYQGQNQGTAESQDVACGDHSACTKYDPNMCNQVWMKRHCKKMCGLCAPLDEETPFSSSLSEETSAQEPCEYSGVVHQSGETWSPGPCVPKCHCDNGHIKCSGLECPDLNCAKPVKRRWKCCPECLPNSDNETRCGVETTGGNGENLCCVFPFNYRGVDYFTCTTADAQEPWCSITRNYDRDGLWGNCVVKSKTGKNHTKLADSDEKTALVFAAQLSSAREWRNSTNNQVTDTLKGMPSPLSEDDLQKLRDKDSDANKVYQNASGVSSDISAQAEYYRKAEVDPAQIAALNNARKSYNNNEAYQRNSTSSVTSPVTSSLTSSATTPLGTSQATSLTSSVTSASSSSTQAVYNNTYNPSNSYAQPTGDSYPYQTTAHPNDKASEVVGTYSDPGVQANQVSYAGESNAGGSTTVGPNTGGSNTEDSQYHSYYGGANNQSSTGAYSGGSYEKGSTANDTYSGSYRQESATKDTTANYPSSVSSYSDSYGQESTAKDTADNYPSGANTYTGSYGQGSTAKDTTDNTVPNGIENQTSYEMHPDASTAQYGNNQLATT